MERILIFGTGKSAEIVERCLNRDGVDVLGYLDNNVEKHGTLLRGRTVRSPVCVREIIFDFVVIATLKYVEVREQLEKQQVGREKIISFFDSTIDYRIYDFLFDCLKWQCCALEQRFVAELEGIRRETNIRIRNMEYEIADKQQRNEYWFPNILSAQEAVDYIFRENCSVCRFGDGEFEIIAGRKRAIFQNTQAELGERLKKILQSNEEGVIICIADNYGSLEAYEEPAAMAIRGYLTPDVRKEHMALLSKEAIYYNAYLSRPYMIYRDKQNAGKRFEALKQIWNRRKVVVVEGENTRMGYHNDLFADAACIQRILCPDKNAWDRYEAILETACSLEKENLLLISLGPVATVLAYDLAKLGYQAIDIGQLDVEYEWFQRKAQQRIAVPDKLVNEGNVRNQVQRVEDPAYLKQIIKTIV